MTRTTEYIRLIEKVVPEKDFITVDENACDGCNACIYVCPSLLWRKRNHKACLVEDYRTLCLECAACYHACVSGAIHFEFPPSGEGIVVRFG